MANLSSYEVANMTSAGIPVSSLSTEAARTAYGQVMSGTSLSQALSNVGATQQAAVANVQSQISSTQAEIAAKQQLLSAATTAGYGAGTGLQIPNTPTSASEIWSAQNYDYSKLISTTDLLNQKNKTLDLEQYEPDNTLLNDALAKLNGSLDKYSKESLSLQNLMAQYQKDYQTGMQGMQKMAGEISTSIASQPSSTDYYQKALEQYGYTPEKLAQKDAYVSQLAGIQQQIANVDLKASEQLGMSEGRKAPMSFIRGEQALIERNANSAKAALAGQASIVQMQIAATKDDLNTAREMASTAVQMFTYDQEQKVNAMKWAFTTYSDIFSAMTTQEKNMIDMIYKQEQDKLDAQRQDYQFQVNKQLEEARLNLQQQTSTTTTNSKELDRVKEIIASHPGEWGNAADQIDAEFGKGTATKYDDLLKSVYQNAVAPKKDLTPEQTSIVNDAKARLDYAKMMYEDYTAIRTQIIEQAKQLYNFDLSLYL